MTEHWPLWVIREKQDDGSWRPINKTISETARGAIKKHNYTPPSDKIDIRECRLEVKP